MDIAEVWAAQNDQLKSLGIFFDTASWKAFISA